ncbi:MAG TPA: glycoside hydrolase family 18 protein [Candidatus Limnocylindrales bacterium]|nr:glycoside hydrolase family 18 protein [Candidatus Limnocylindrales bacterium]
MRSPRSLVPFLALLLAVATGCSPAAPASPSPAGMTDEPPASAPGPTATPPVPGHELYGYLPYWEARDGILEHLRETPLSTLALFSVTHTSKGALNTRQQGYRMITGATGRRIIREAQARGTRVEIVYTSFGAKRNQGLFTDAARQDGVIAALVELVTETGADGVNVDVEVLDPVLVPAFAGFVGRLREAVRDADPADQVSAATGAGPLGAAMAAAASGAGADRIFLMGYDYRVAASSPGASAPLDRSDGGEKSLRWSLDLYASLGVPPERLLLGLPLYGMTWPVAGPVIGAPETGRGDAWIPRKHTALLTDGSITPQRDEIEQVDVYFGASDGSWGAPSPGASLVPSAMDRTWTAVYVDSPGTLAPKMTLANERGLAGSGFWAIGYERGLPGYRGLMEAFVKGEPLP